MVEKIGSNVLRNIKKAFEWMSNGGNTLPKSQAFLNALKEKILNLLKSDHDKYFSIQDISERLEISYHLCRVLLFKLVAEGKVEFIKIGNRYFFKLKKRNRKLGKDAFISPVLEEDEYETPLESELIIRVENGCIVFLLNGKVFAISLEELYRIVEKHGLISACNDIKDRLIEHGFSEDIVRREFKAIVEKVTEVIKEHKLLLNYAK